MVLPAQVLHVYYKGYTLSVLDSDDKTCIYNVKWPHLAFEIFPSGPTTQPPIASSSFSILTTKVKLLLHSREILLYREKTFTRSYTYMSPGPSSTGSEFGHDKAVGQKMKWEAEEILSGDFKLVNEAGQVAAWFRNKTFSTTELGRFEIMAGMEGREVEVLLTGLAMLAMVQSGQLGLMVIAGR
ncbi:hypothetical protein IFR05_016980 [Cadophora sp. M221]|nr:hypothetical protein IFR05_016980 [Cadophora sp. M221]